MTNHKTLNHLNGEGRAVTTRILRTLGSPDAMPALAATALGLAVSALLLL